MSKLRGYIASHFFDRGGYLQTEELADFLIKEFPNIEWYVPHRNDDINDKKENDSLITDVKVYQADIPEQLMHANIVIGCLDGVEIDSGVAGEIIGKAVQNELEEENYHVTMDTGDGSIGIRPKRKDLIVGYTTDMRRNKTDMEFLNEIKDLLNDLRYRDVLEKMENHKENFLYRNIMITGAVNRWGKLVNGETKNTKYLDSIKIAIDKWLEEEYNENINEK